MTESRPLVEPHLEGGDIEAVALAIATGYKACNDLMRGNLALSTFPVGMEQRPYLLRALVDHAMLKVATQREGFFHDVKWNAAHNCRSLILTKGQVVMTQHFMGKKNFRKAARQAKSRESMACRNGSLFPVDEECIALFSDGGYVQFLHGGHLIPDFIHLVIPTEDQRWYSARSEILVPTPETVAAEQIREEMAFQLKTIADQEAEEIGNATVAR